MKKDEIELKDLFEDFKLNILANLNCHSIGEIVSFNNSTQTAKIKIMYKRKFNNEYVSYPILLDCPCVILSGGSVSLRMPIKSGDSCLILFNDRDIDNWYISGEEKILNSDRMHDLSDGIALVGIRHLKNNLSDFSSDEAGIVAEDMTKIRIENGALNLKMFIDTLLDTIASTTITIPYGSSAGTFPIDNSSAITALKIIIGGLLK